MYNNNTISTRFSAEELEEFANAYTLAYMGETIPDEISKLEDVKMNEYICNLYLHEVYIIKNESETLELSTHKDQKEKLEEFIDEYKKEIGNINILEFITSRLELMYNKQDKYQRMFLEAEILRQYDYI